MKRTLEKRNEIPRSSNFIIQREKIWHKTVVVEYRVMGKVECDYERGAHDNRNTEKHPEKYWKMCERI